MSSDDDSQLPNGHRRTGAVLDGAGAWEDALRAGQKAQGQRGSVEPELAVLHLLRHAGAAQELADDRLDALWEGVQHSITADEVAAAPAPWWKRSWSWAGGAALAGVAAAVVLIVVLPKGGPNDDPQLAQTTPRTSMADKIEKQFELLAPKAREQVEREADDNRDTLRGNLLTDALAAAEGSIGGAP